MQVHQQRLANKNSNQAPGEHSHEFFRPSSAPLPIPSSIGRNVQPAQNVQVNPILVNNQPRFTNNIQMNQPFQNLNNPQSFNTINQQMRFSQPETAMPGQQQFQPFQANFQPAQFGRSFQPNVQMTVPFQQAQSFQPVLPNQPVQPFQSIQSQVPIQPAQPVQPIQQPVQNLQPQVPIQPIQSVQPVLPIQPAQPPVPQQFTPNQVIRK
jgi:hypothetical protein